jgi:hypothetical protein
MEIRAAGAPLETPSSCALETLLAAGMAVALPVATAETGCACQLVPIDGKIISSDGGYKANMARSPLDGHTCTANKWCCGDSVSASSSIACQSNKLSVAGKVRRAWK